MHRMKTLVPLVLVWTISFPLYAIDIDGDGLHDYQVSAGYHNTCATDDNGVQCWGWDIYGQSTVPTDLVNPVEVSAGYQHIAHRYISTTRIGF